MKKHCKNFLIIFYSITICIIFSLSAAAAPLSHPNRKEIEKLNETACARGFSFIVMGDSHTDNIIFETLRDTATAMRPDFVVSVGDVTNNGTEEEYALYLGRIEASGLAWLTVPGNHEYRTPEGHTSLTGPPRFKRIFGGPDFAFAHCGWKFIGLDIVAFDTLLPKQMNWLKDQLKGFEGRAVVFMHYPPALIKGWEEGYWTANGKEFMKLLEDDRARYFFSGHIHVFDRLQIGPTTYIITGGASAGVDKDKPKDTFNAPDGGAFSHFIYVLVQGDKATEFVVRPEP